MLHDAQLRTPPNAEGAPWATWRRRNPPTFDRAELIAWREWVDAKCPGGDWDYTGWLKGGREAAAKAAAEVVKRKNKRR